MSTGGLAKLALALTVLGVSGCTLNRPEDPVVLSGAQLPALASVAAGDVVAFRWVNSWDQVPVQVDERKSVNFTTVYNNAVSANFVTTVYADPGTSDQDAAGAAADALPLAVLLDRARAPARSQSPAMPRSSASSERGSTPYSRS